MADFDSIIRAVEPVLDAEGVSATGMDRLTRAAGVSTRTLYKHAGSRARLVAGVLDARGARFLEGMPRDSVAGLFTGLERWTAAEGARGCFFLRCLGEAAPADPALAERIRAHKAAVADRIAECVTADLGRPDALLTEQVLVLFEGATHAAVYRGEAAIAAARHAAVALVGAAVGQGATD
ncbi:MAG: TetR/AcrR family transcriptional regulator [Azospirillaceae bacterium]